MELTRFSRFKKLDVMFAAFINFAHVGEGSVYYLRLTTCDSAGLTEPALVASPP